MTEKKNMRGPSTLGIFKFFYPFLFQVMLWIRRQDSADVDSEVAVAQSEAPVEAPAAAEAEALRGVVPRRFPGSCWLRS